MPRTPFNPATGKHFAFTDDESNVAVVTVEEEGYDAVRCSDNEGNRVLVAKPRDLRKSVFHTVTIDGRVYTSRDLNTRDVAHPSFAGRVWYSETFSPYVVGERIVVFKHAPVDRVLVALATGELGIEADEAGNHLLEWEDMNAAGRHWDSGEKASFTLVSQADNKLVCTDSNGGTAHIAKPPRIRRATWAGQTINGVTYAYVDSSTRTATGAEPAEEQLITPSYVVGQEIRTVKTVYVDPTDAFPYFWEDIGAGREWAVLAPPAAGADGETLAWMGF